MLEFGIFLHSLISGFMIFFMSVVTPSVFSILNEDEAGKLLRVIFPRMFIYGLIITIFSCAIFFVISTIDFLIISLVSAAFFLINLIYLTPRINIYRDKFKGGIVEAEKKFKMLHFFSVVLFISQLFGSIFIVFVYFY